MEESDRGPDTGLEFTPVWSEQMFVCNSSSIFLVQSLCSHASFPGPASLELPDGQPDGLLVEFFHYLFDSWQVGASDGEVAPGGAHLVAHLALLAAEAVALSPGRHSVLSWVQQAPVVTIRRWKPTHINTFDFTDCCMLKKSFPGTCLFNVWNIIIHHFNGLFSKSYLTNQNCTTEKKCIISD